ncbi:MAG: S-layer homology domain-containing protein, partial [Bacillota bacterium]|nr:S-layer homology domain-containing protein [Bacillota bacterium]
TPISVLQKSGLSVTVKSGYVKTIDGLSEFEHGANSGWMYGVNGVYPKTGADSFKLKDGDGVCWKYTNDGGTDIGAGTGEETETLIEDKKDCADKLELIKAALVKKSELSAWELYALCASGVKADASKLGAVIKEVGEQQGNIRKPTDIAKYALTVKAAGGDPENAGGYNLIAMLYGNKNLLLQGNNGPIFALITLNSGYYNIPENALWTKQRLKEYIISAQNDDGGYSLVKSGKSDADITAMALQALALYRGQAGAKATIDKALDFLSKNQQDNGGFISDGVNNSESAAQAVIALTALGIDPFSDKRFIKNNSTALSALGTFLRKDNTFSHLSGGESDGMATEQGAMALAAMCRFVSGAAPIFEIEPYYYDDLGSASAWAIDPIVKATKSAIVNGSDGMFRPKSDVTRAEFAAMLSRMLGLDGSGLSTAFSDVKDGSWYKNAVAAAYERKIIEGSNGFFYPDRKITREEMAVMISRAVKLAAGDRTPGDSGSVSSWALAGVKASFSARIMEGSGNAFRPSERVTREMAATVCQRSAAYAK